MRSAADNCAVADRLTLSCAEAAIIGASSFNRARKFPQRSIGMPPGMLSDIIKLADGANNPAPSASWT